MDFRDLEYFVAVAEDESFSRAAERLIVAQPTLSKTVARLEKTADVPLFLRKQHGLELTEEGRRFVEIARKLLKTKRDLDEEMQTIAHGQAGRIHLGISHTFSRSLIPKVLPVYSRDHPGVEVVIHTETSAVLEQLLLDDEIDVAVIVGTVGNALLTYETLFHEQLLLAVASDTPLSGKAIKRKGEDYPYLEPAMLKNQRFILSQERMRLRESADAFFRAEGIAPEIAVTTASNMTALRLASHGVGVAFLPYSYTQLNLDPPLPLFFSTAATLANWKVDIVIRTKNKASPILGAFIQAFKNAI